MPVAQRTNLTDAIVTAAPRMTRGHDDVVHIRGHEVALHRSIIVIVMLVPSAQHGHDHDISEIPPRMAFTRPSIAVG